MSKQLLGEVKKSIVFIGRTKQRSLNEVTDFHIEATGFLVFVDGIDHLVTAKHVVVDTHKRIVSQIVICIYFSMEKMEELERGLLNR
jgi:hypothetical protein